MQGDFTSLNIGLSGIKARRLLRLVTAAHPIELAISSRFISVQVGDALLARPKQSSRADLSRRAETHFAFSIRFARSY
jgi:hypothetical protein